MYNKFSRRLINIIVCSNAQLLLLLVIVIVIVIIIVFFTITNCYYVSLKAPSFKKSNFLQVHSIHKLEALLSEAQPEDSLQSAENSMNEGSISVPFTNNKISTDSIQKDQMNASKRICSSLTDLANQKASQALTEVAEKKSSNQNSSSNDDILFIDNKENSLVNMLLNNDSPNASVGSKLGATTNNDLANTNGILKKRQTNNSLETSSKKLSFSGSFQELQSNARTQSSRLLSVAKHSNHHLSDSHHSNISSLAERRISFCSVTATPTKVMSVSTRERNVTYKLGFIMVTFLVCWLPFSILWPLSSIIGIQNINNNVYLFSFWLAYANSFFTPVILLYNNAKYRQALTLFRGFGCFQADTKRSFMSLDGNSFFSQRDNNSVMVKRI